MVQSIINLDENENKIINITKGLYGFKNKNEAIKHIIQEFGDTLEPQLRPEYIEKLNRIRKEKGIRFKNIHELRKHIENAKV